MNGKRFLWGLALVLLASAAVAAPSVKAPVCGLKVESPWVRAAPPMAMDLAGYATLGNDCRTAITITSVSGRDFGMAMVHETEVKQGVSTMQHMDSTTVPAGGHVDFAPGGKHLMLMAPTRALKPGDKVALVFRLAGGGRVEVEFPVRREAPAPPAYP